jgi:hypothetical protein
MDGILTEFGVAGADAADEVGFCGLSGSLRFVAAVEFVVWRYDLQVDVLTVEVVAQVGADDVVGHGVLWLEGFVGVFAAVFVDDVLVPFDVLSVGGISGEWDDVDKFASGPGVDSNEEAVLADVVGCVRVKSTHGGAKIKGGDENLLGVGRGGGCWGGARAAGDGGGRLEVLSGAM